VDLGGTKVESVEVCEKEISEVVNTFGERPPGTLISLFSSTGDLIISVVNGSAEEHVGGKVKAGVTVILQD
jgi:S-adenosylmethionine hydrolase